MSHTNSTTNYALPQFQPTDKPAWLTDVNAAYSDIDTAIKNAQDAADAAQGDATQALLDASTASTAAATADAKGAGATASIEAAFDPSTIYAVGAKVMYNSLLYRCIVAVVTPGPWTGSANWERITVDSLIDTMSNTLANVSSDVTDLKSIADISSQFTVGGNVQNPVFTARVFYNPATRHVFGSITISSPSAITTATNLVNIGSGYRPSSNIRVPMLVTTLAGACSPYYGNIEAVGNVFQSASNNANGVFIPVDYFI